MSENVDWKSLLEQRLAESRRSRRDEAAAAGPDPDPTTTRELLDKLLNAAQSGELATRDTDSRTIPAPQSRPPQPGPRRPGSGTRRPPSERMQPIAYVPSHRPWDRSSHRHGRRRLSIRRLRRAGFWVLMLAILITGLILTLCPDLLSWRRSNGEPTGPLLEERVQPPGEPAVPARPGPAADRNDDGQSTEPAAQTRRQEPAPGEPPGEARDDKRTGDSAGRDAPDGTGSEPAVRTEDPDTTDEKPQKPEPPPENPDTSPASEESGQAQPKGEPPDVGLPFFTMPPEREGSDWMLLPPTPPVPPTPPTKLTPPKHKDDRTDVDN